MARYIVADWHCGESRFEIMNRHGFKDQQDMVDQLVGFHNELVKEDDTVYVVGDVVNKNTPEFLHHVQRFNGKKILFRGNHDRSIKDEEFLKYFDKIYQEGDGETIKVKIDDGKVWDLDCYITHYPTWAKRDYFNLVGHIHSAWKFQLNMFNVGIDCNHYRPHNIDVAVPFAYKAIRDFYDEDVWVAYAEQNKSYRHIRGKEGSYLPRG